LSFTANCSNWVSTKMQLERARLQPMACSTSLLQLTFTTAVACPRYESSSVPIGQEVEVDDDWVLLETRRSLPSVRPSACLSRSLSSVRSFCPLITRLISRRGERAPRGVESYICAHKRVCVDCALSRRGCGRLREVLQFLSAGMS